MLLTAVGTRAQSRRTSMIIFVSFLYSSLSLWSYRARNQTVFYNTILSSLFSLEVGTIQLIFICHLHDHWCLYFFLTPDPKDAFTDVVYIKSLTKGLPLLRAASAAAMRPSCSFYLILCTHTITRYCLCVIFASASHWCNDRLRRSARRPSSPSSPPVVGNVRAVLGPPATILFPITRLSSVFLLPTPFLPP